MLHRIHPESIYAHINILVVAVNQILVDHRILRVKVHTIPGDLSGLDGVRLPGEAFSV